MARSGASLLSDLSTKDLKRLLAARERIDILESEQSRLLADLAKVEKELSHLLGGGGVAANRVTKNSTRGRKKKSAVGRPRKISAKGRPGRVKSAPRKASGRVKLEDVIVAVLKNNGQAMDFKDLYGAIVGGKLFKTKSKKFDNVLRRTLSTSKLVTRVARGVYDVA